MGTFIFSCKQAAEKIRTEVYLKNTRRPIEKQKKTLLTLVKAAGRSHLTQAKQRAGGLDHHIRLVIVDYTKPWIQQTIAATGPAAETT